MAATATLWNKQMHKFLANPEEMFGLLIQPILWVVLFGVGMKSMLWSSALWAAPSAGVPYG
jgi:ABC-2 type transport system permease protein